MFTYEGATSNKVVIFSADYKKNVKKNYPTSLSVSKSIIFDVRSINSKNRIFDFDEPWQSKGRLWYKTKNVFTIFEECLIKCMQTFCYCKPHNCFELPAHYKF